MSKMGTRLGKAFLAAALGVSLSMGMAWGAPADSAAADSQKTVTQTEQKTPLKNQKIVINLAAKSLALIEDGKKIRLYPIGPGKASTPTPTGYYAILSKDINPSWIDPEDPKKVIESGEQNPLGYRWMAIKGNYGIHGTNKPDSVGHYVSNGCIRMHEEDVEALFELVEIGTPVEITYNRVVVERIADGTVVYYIYPDGYSWQELNKETVETWLAGYGVDKFVSDEEIEKKIADADGNPTYIAKVYGLTVNGQKLKGKAIIKDDVTYLPAAEIAETLAVPLAWDRESELLSTAYGEAAAIDKKGTAFLNADDAETLFNLAGGLNKEGVYALKSVSGVMPIETTEPVSETKTSEVKADEQKAETKSKTLKSDSIDPELRAEIKAELKEELKDELKEEIKAELKAEAKANK